MRHEDWPERLNAAIEARRDTAFRYGVSDCALFAADVIYAMTGEDLASPWRGKYKGRKRADRIRREDGDLPELVTRQLGPPIGVLFAQRGDLAYFDIDGGTLGVVVGSQVALPARPSGLSFRPLREARFAWRVA